MASRLSSPPNTRLSSELRPHEVLSRSLRSLSARSRLALGLLGTAALAALLAAASRLASAGAEPAAAAPAASLNLTYQADSAEAAEAPPAPDRPVPAPSSAAPARCFCGTWALARASKPEKGVLWAARWTTYAEPGELDLGSVRRVRCGEACDLGDGAQAWAEPGMFPFAALALEGSAHLRDTRSGLTVHAPNDKVAAQGRDLQRGLRPLPPLWSVAGDSQPPPSLAAGLLALPNYCNVNVGCRKLSLAKVKLHRGQEQCTGFTDQTLSNGTDCVQERRGHNRMNCLQAQLPKKRHFEELYVQSNGLYFSFQHFAIDRFPAVVAAYEQLASRPQAKLQVLHDKRGAEMFSFLGYDADRFVLPNLKQSFCAKTVWMDAPMPGKYGNGFDNKLAMTPRPPELFRYASDALVDRAFRAGRPKRDRVVMLSRGAADSFLSNLDAVRKVLRSRGLPFEEVDASQLSVKALVHKLARARIIVGVHGGQMANVIFAQADRNTSVIEIAGRQVPFKSYYYDGMAAAFDYHLVPRMCKSSRGAPIHPTNAELGKCRGGAYCPIRQLEDAIEQSLGGRGVEGRRQVQ